VITISPNKRKKGTIKRSLLPLTIIRSSRITAVYKTKLRACIIQLPLLFSFHKDLDKCVRPSRLSSNCSLISFIINFPDSKRAVTDVNPAATHTYNNVVENSIFSLIKAIGAKMNAEIIDNETMSALIISTQYENRSILVSSNAWAARESASMPPSMPVARTTNFVALMTEKSEPNPLKACWARNVRGSILEVPTRWEQQRRQTLREATQTGVSNDTESPHKYIRYRLDGTQNIDPSAIKARPSLPKPGWRPGPS